MAIDKPLILPYGEASPFISPQAFIAPTAVLIGNTSVHAYAGVFFHCVLRGDINRIEVGEGSNIQDLTMMHVDDDYPCIVGCNVTVGHSAVLHGCVVEDNCLIGMGAVVLSGATIGAGSLVAAGGVVPEGMVVPPGHLVAGVPAKVRKQLDTASKKEMLGLAYKYRDVSRTYMLGGFSRPTQDGDERLGNG